ncbi:hypothetical protein ACLB6G_01280 [Zhengella sp. ZM62]|uniref:hypothetical protein n=1 Tax=Zhengella sedimenti TaxID=3390035 RepID=UPI00397706C1
MRLGDLAFRLFMRASIIAALALASFAHKPVDLSAWQTFELSAYELPDGSLPVICFGTDDRDAGGETGRTEACAFCQIAGSVALPLPDGSSEPADLAVVQPLFPTDTTHLASFSRRLLPPKHGPPPIVI